MSNPNQPPQQQPEPRLPDPYRPIPPKKNRTLLVGIIAGVLGLGVGGAVGASGDGTTTAGPGATTTVTATATATKTVTETAGSEPTDQPTDTGGYTPHKSDWQIGIKILKNTCFDTAGASISYRIKPEFVGTVKPPEEGTVEVSYRVTGGEGGPNDNTFTVTGGQMSYDEQEDVDTPSCSTKLKAKVTDVSYDG